jgi:hypothetical protein
VTDQPEPAVEPLIVGNAPPRLDPSAARALAAAAEEHGFVLPAHVQADIDADEASPEADKPALAAVLPAHVPANSDAGEVSPEADKPAPAVKPLAKPPSHKPAQAGDDA